MEWGWVGVGGGGHYVYFKDNPSFIMTMINLPQVFVNNTLSKWYKSLTMV